MPNRSTARRLALAVLLTPMAAPLSAGFIIDSEVTDSQTLASGTGEVTSAGRLTVGGGTVSINVTGTASIDNQGVIEQTGTGRAIDLNTGSPTLTVGNGAGATITSANADTFRVNRAAANVSLDNAGTIRSTNRSAGGSQAIDWTAITSGSNRLDNRASGLIEASAADAVRPGSNGVVNNAGSIRAVPVVEDDAGSRVPSGSDGVDTQTRSGVSITNSRSGQIAGRHGITGGSNSVAITITVTNETGASITGVNGSGINIDSPGSSAIIDNRGLIEGRFDAATYDIGDGDGVDVDGTVVLNNRGSIRGIGASLGNNPEGVSIGGGTVRNYAGAVISGDNPLANGALGQGLLVDNSDGGAAFAATDLTNAGLIQGVQGFAVRFIGDFADRIENQAGGQLRGAGAGAAVQTGGGADSVSNAGAIQGDGGAALDLGAGDDGLTITGGQAGIVGSIDGGADTDTLRFEPGSGNRFQYTGAISNIETLSVLSGTVTLGGSASGALGVASGATLAPGDGIGTLNLVDLALTSGAILAVELDPAANSGTGRADQIRLSGSADLGFADLLLSLLSLPTPGQFFDLLVTNGTVPVGRFAQGERVSAGFGGRQYAFAIDYAADGNAVRLTALPTPLAPTAWLLIPGLAALVRRRGGRGGAQRRVRLPHARWPVGLVGLRLR